MCIKSLSITIGCILYNHCVVQNIMGRKLRRDLSMFSIFETTNQILSENDFCEIAKFVMFLDQGLSRTHDVGIFNYIASQETIMLYNDRIYKCNKFEINCHKCQIYSHITSLYLKVFEKVATSYQIGTCIVGMYLIVLTVEAYNKEFRSMLAYVKFLNQTIYKENGKYRVACDDIQKQIKRRVNLQQNLQARWGIHIQETEEDIQWTPPKPKHIVQGLPCNSYTLWILNLCVLFIVIYRGTAKNIIDIFKKLFEGALEQLYGRYYPKLTNEELDKL